MGVMGDYAQPGVATVDKGALCQQSSEAWAPTRSDFRGEDPVCGLRSRAGVSPSGSGDRTANRLHVLYRHSDAKRSRFWIRLTNGWFLGLFTTTLLFLALPFCQVISFVSRTRSDLVSIDLSRPPPPVPVEAEPPPPVEEKERASPKLTKAIPRLTLSQLELALDPGMGDGLGGADFSINFSTSSLDEIEMIYNPSEVDRIPRPVYQASPVYPIELKRQGVDGVVVLIFVCSNKGRVRDIRVRSSPNIKFETAAVRALRQWKFRPGKLDGESVDVRMLVPFQFDSSR